MMKMITIAILSVSRNACAVPINNSLDALSTLCTGIDDLGVFVPESLRTVNWQYLGTKLGLAYSTLEQIEMEHKGNVTLCMNDMLTAWLLQRDNVSRIGTPSLSVLKSTLEEIGEKRIDGEMLSIRYCMHMHVIHK